MAKTDISSADTHDGILLQAATAVPQTLQGDETFIAGYGTKTQQGGSLEQQRIILLDKLSIMLARLSNASGPGQAKLSAMLERLQNSALSINLDDPGASHVITSLYSQEEGCSRELDKLLGVSTDEKDPLNLAVMHQQLTPEARLEQAIRQHYLIKPMDERILELTILHHESLIIEAIVEEGIREIREGIDDLKTTLSVAKALEEDDIDTAIEVKEEAVAKMTESAAKEETRLVDKGAITTDSELDAYRKKSLSDIQKRIESIDEAAADLRQDGTANGFNKAYERFVVQPADKLMQRHAEVSGNSDRHPDRDTRKLVEGIKEFHEKMDKSASLAQMEQSFNEHVKTVYDNSDVAAKEAMLNTEFRNQELDFMLKKRQKMANLLSGFSNEPDDFANVASMMEMQEDELRKAVSTFRRKHHLVAVPAALAQGQERPAR